MTDKTNNSLTPVATQPGRLPVNQPGPSPVRVKLRRVNANLAQVSVQQNEDMRRISAWVAIAAVPTAIAGIYGMNFDHMPELRWQFGYPAVLALMAVICLALYRGFKRNHWL